MKSNTEFNKYKVKNDELYLPKSGGKVEGETVFTGGVRFSSGDPKNDLVIKDKRSLGTATGHEYDLEFNTDLDEVTLTEDSVDKTTLPLIAEKLCTRAEYNNMTAEEKARYRIYHFTGDSAPSQTMLSYVGMVIHSTTLNSEAMVKQIYGNDTSWILHDGYVLRGSASGVLADNAVKDGGEDTVTLTIQQMPAHGHPVLRQQWYGSDTVVSSSTGAIYSWKSGAGTGGSTSMSYKKSNNGNDTLDTGGGQSHNNMQSYKNVFIWERIS